jgi:adenylosuccinate lyase
MPFSSLTALSPLDGRYAGKLDALRPEFSEYGLIRRRLQIEIEWLKTLAAEPHFAEIPTFSPATLAEVDALLADFSPLQAAEVKAIETVTNHDVKALEYWIRKRLAANAEVTQVAEFIHFACTSEGHQQSRACADVAGRSRRNDVADARPGDRASQGTCSPVG